MGGLMGAVTTVYRASAALTVTDLHSIAASSTWTAGWYSGVIDNTTELDLDKTISGIFQRGATAGEIRVYAFAQRYDATYRSAFGSANTPGATQQVTGSGMTAEKRDAGMVLLWATAFASSAGATLEMADVSLRGAFGGFLPPMVNLFVAISGAALDSSGSALYVKGYSESVAA